MQGATRRARFNPDRGSRRVQGVAARSVGPLRGKKHLQCGRDRSFLGSLKRKPPRSRNWRSLHNVYPPPKPSKPWSTSRGSSFTKAYWTRLRGCRTSGASSQDDPTMAETERHASVLCRAQAGVSNNGRLKSVQFVI